ncbi:hypothetical protein [Nostoc commune]|uniref:hypothetical protein n=1 Tax=Nostoc commune TaxID=1178 RepID=UPI0018C7FAB5|nr:hypothetical protein [Nostoc commune]
MSRAWSHRITGALDTTELFLGDRSWEKLFGLLMLSIQVNQDKIPRLRTGKLK